MDTGNKLMGAGAFLITLAFALTLLLADKSGVIDSGSGAFRVPLRDADPAIADKLPCQEDSGTLIVRPIYEATGEYFRGLTATAQYGEETVHSKTRDDGTLVFEGVSVGAQSVVRIDANKMVWTGDRISEKHVPLQRSHENCTAETALYLTPLNEPRPSTDTTNIDQDGWGPQSAPAPLALLPGHEQYLVSSVPVDVDPDEEQFFMGLSDREQARVTMSCNGHKVDNTNDPKELIFDYKEAKDKGFIKDFEAAGFQFLEGPGGKLQITGPNYSVSVLLDADKCSTRKSGGWDFSGQGVSIVQLMDGTVAVLDDKCLNLITPPPPTPPTPTPTNTRTSTVTPTGTVPATKTPTNTATPTRTPTVTPTRTPTNTPVSKFTITSVPSTSTPVPPTATSTPGCPGDCKTPTMPVATQPPATGTAVFTATPTQCPSCEPEEIPVGTRTPSTGPSPTPGIGDY